MIRRNRKKKKRISQEIESLLGKMTDGRVAKLARVSRSVICRHRQNLGIEPYKGCNRYHEIEWEKYIKFLGKRSDGEIASEIGCCKSFISRKRNELEIEKFDNKCVYDWQKFDKLLGNMPDKQIAERIGCHPATVWHRRSVKGILPFYAKEFAEDMKVHSRQDGMG